MLALTIASQAFAQDVPAQDTGEEAGLKDIVVTAQRREENLQRAASMAPAYTALTAPP